MGDPEELKISEYQRMFDIHPQPMLVCDVNTLGFLAVNNTAVAKYDYTKEEFLEIGLKDILLQEDVQNVLEIVAGVSPDLAYSGEWRHQLKDGRVIDVEVTCHGLVFAGYQAILLVANDITKRKQAAESLQKRVERASKIFHISPAATTLTTVKEGRFVGVNASALKLFGYTRDEMIGHTAVELGLWTTKDRDRIIKELAVAGSIRDSEIQLRTKTGEVRNLYGAVEFIEVGDEKLLLMSGIDITERKQAEESLRESEARYRAVFEGATIGLSVGDHEGRLLAVNSVLADITGYSKERLLTTTFMAITHPEDINADLGLFQKLKDREISDYEIEKRYIHKDGHSVWINLKVAPFPESGSDELAVIGMVEDITAIKQSQNKLRMLTHAIEQSANAILITDSQGTIEYVNPQFTTMTGYGPDEAIGENPRILRGVEKPAEEYKILWDTITAGEDWYGEFHNKKKNGELNWVQASISPIKDEQGEITHFVGVQEDISELKRTRQIFDLASKAANVGIWEWDIKTNITYWSEMNYRLLGLPPGSGSASYDDWLNAVHPDERDVVQREVEAAVARKRSLDFEYRCVWPDGNIHWIRDIGRLVLSANQEPVRMYGIQVDITQHKKTEEALEQFAKRLQVLHEIDRAILMAHSSESIAQGALQQIRQLVPCLGGAITLIDRETQEAELIFADVNSAVSAQTGTRFPLSELAVIGNVVSDLQRGEVYTLNDLGVLSQISPGLRILSDIGLGSVINFPLSIQNELIGALSVGIADGEALTKEHIEFVSEVANQLSIAFRQAHLWDQNQRHAEELEGRIQDRTVKLREANEQLKELDRMKDIFLSTAAHELRTPLTSIQGFSEILMTRKLSPDRQRSYLETINKQSAQLAQIIDDLLDISRLEAGLGLDLKPEPVDMAPLAAEAVQPFIDTLSGHHFALEGLAYAPPVQGDPFRINQVLRNLLSNAVKYSPEGGTIVIRAETEAEYLAISVQDEGIGMTEEEQAHLFERFYRADAASRSIGGTGLGLTICKLIVEGHGGQIRVKSRNGVGSTFTFTVPLAEPNRA